VVNAAGAPLAGATVAVLSSAGPHPDIAAVTAADGSFRLHGLWAGAAVVEAHREAAAGAAAVEIVSGETAQVEIVVR
jgi:phage gp45-like